MKPSSSLLLCSLGLAALLTGLRAAPLSATTAIQTHPDPAAPVIGYLKAGTEPTPVAAAPQGWVAVSAPGPFDGYVRNADFDKALDVVPGSNVYLRPSTDAGVLAVAAKGDKFEITGLQGKWTRIRLNQPVIGYASVGPSAEAPLSAAPVPVAAPVAPNNDPGHAAPATDLTPGNLMPRFFEGRFTSTRHVFAPRRPYDWELDTIGNARVAYIDVSRLLQTDQIKNYLGHTVLVYGAALPVPGTPDIVVIVDSLRLK